MWAILPTICTHKMPKLVINLCDKSNLSLRTYHTWWWPETTRKDSEFSTLTLFEKFYDNSKLFFVIFSNFSNYRARFSMPQGTESLMYSFNLGPVHFIGFSTEVYYFLNYGLKTMVNQYEWLEKDLIEATKPENRQVSLLDKDLTNKILTYQNSSTGSFVLGS